MRDSDWEFVPERAGNARPLDPSLPMRKSGKAGAPTVTVCSTDLAGGINASARLRPAGGSSPAPRPVSKAQPEQTTATPHARPSHAREQAAQQAAPEAGAGTSLFVSIQREDSDGGHTAPEQLLWDAVPGEGGGGGHTPELDGFNWSCAEDVGQLPDVSTFSTEPLPVFEEEAIELERPSFLLALQHLPAAPPSKVRPLPKTTEPLDSTLVWDTDTLDRPLLLQPEYLRQHPPPALHRPLSALQRAEAPSPAAVADPLTALTTSAPVVCEHGAGAEAEAEHRRRVRALKEHDERLQERLFEREMADWQAKVRRVRSQAPDPSIPVRSVSTSNVPPLLECLSDAELRQVARQTRAEVAARNRAVVQRAREESAEALRSAHLDLAASRAMGGERGRMEAEGLGAVRRAQDEQHLEQARRMHEARAWQRRRKQAGEEDRLFCRQFGQSHNGLQRYMACARLLQRRALQRSEVQEDTQHRRRLTQEAALAARLHSELRHRVAHDEAREQVHEVQWAKEQQQQVWEHERGEVRRRVAADRAQHALHARTPGKLDWNRPADRRRYPTHHVVAS